MQNNFAEMFLTMLSNKTCINNFAPPNKRAVRAVDKIIFKWHILPSHKPH